MHHCLQYMAHAKIWKLTDDIREVEAIREAASWSVGWIINAIRWRISTSSSGQVIVVATVNK